MSVPPTTSRRWQASRFGSASQCWLSSALCGVCSPGRGCCAGRKTPGGGNCCSLVSTTCRAAAAQALAGLGCGLVALWAVTAVITVVVGRSSKVDISPAELFLAVAVVAAAAMFLALGALASQLAPTRRQASTYASAVLGELRPTHGRRLGNRLGGSGGRHHLDGSRSCNR